ncbi:hypothetical protein BH20ACI2_BH20ACI2_01110 [soil metagenome]
MKNRFNRSTAIAVLVLSANLISLAQAGAKATVDERNVRAQMNFLASDAMQGRGSGTMFERIAAEYIGSQFMQFGLEPAGHNGWDGKPSFVQTIEVVGRPRLKDLRFGRMSSMFTLGKEWVALSIASTEIRGTLREILLSESAGRDDIVLVRLNEDDTLQSIQQNVTRLYNDGAAAVIITETKELRERWKDLGNLRPAVSRRGTLIAVDRPSGNFLSTLAKNPANDPIEIYADFAEPEKGYTWNAAGKITGSDPKLSSEVIVLSSHLDHLGVRENTPGDDKIFNGADDDASGTVAVMELARILAAGKRPKRTVYFVCYGSEEAGGLGSNYFSNNLPFPKESLVANLQFEMIGRPDAKVKPDELWLTGYERSNLGPELAKRGAKIVQDPHPTENFFRRSDNYILARQGIIAHTVSSFGLHTDYHRASDELKTIDFGHMTRSIGSMIKPVEWLVNSDFRPTWNEGMKP